MWGEFLRFICGYLMAKALDTLTARGDYPGSAFGGGGGGGFHDDHWVPH
jgi:hypothetical protein